MGQVAMKILDLGHSYALGSLDGDACVVLTFVKRFREDANHAGTTNQEILRVLIDRVLFLDAEKPWRGNEEILAHLRAALVLHECRALERKVEKGELLPETVIIDKTDGHFHLS
jgi:hypothetical protein